MAAARTASETVRRVHPDAIAKRLLKRGYGIVFPVYEFAW